MHRPNARPRVAIRNALLGGLWLALGAGPAAAYPGGTPGFQTNAAPYCASCHSSRSEEALAGVPGDRAAKELADNKHLALITAGEGDYGKLTPPQRAELVAQIRAVDAASKAELTAPPKLKPNEVFSVTVQTTGGAGPVVGVALVDADHRWLARPAPGAGWQVVGAPKILGQDFKEQTEWLSRRPEAMGRNLSFVNVLGISSDASKAEWGRAEVVFTLRAPSEPGVYPLAAAYFYGTEKATTLGRVEDPLYGPVPLGGFTGHSGRIFFTPVMRIQVQ